MFFSATYPEVVREFAKEYPRILDLKQGLANEKECDE